MNVLHDVFPFDLPPGMSFFWFYLLVGTVLGIGTKVLRDAIGRGLDRAATRPIA